MVNLRLPISSLAPAPTWDQREHNTKQYFDHDDGDRSCGNYEDNDDDGEGGDSSLHRPDKWVFAGVASRREGGLLAGC